MYFMHICAFGRRYFYYHLGGVDNTYHHHHHRGSCQTEVYVNNLPKNVGLSPTSQNDDKKIIETQHKQ